MAKLLLVFLAFFTINIIAASKNEGRAHREKLDSSDSDQKLSRVQRKYFKFCSNSTVAQMYLKEILSVVDILQANSSYNTILNLQLTNFIAYLKDTKNQEILSNDCQAFLKGLKEANKADKTIQRQQKNMATLIRKNLEQAARSVTNGKGFYDLDS
ncbi:unnamed protein product [Rotaria socialis]|uniref:Uncharacterized protein n=1 Tax=Rotaria socialis TaxID=392032 RepID=A0A818V449_9BILA|nr:unnamed protein product [Rotaria socialis]CAF3361376.1 unnamed protein product [Rotaria socialis]CAF3672904.1 unnamed protein product [Rotaria socialis]CAF3706912.1 unnamed protein product [Rotaria socialis]CAF4316036.1 unnamed protein product [Rotaria socialis]